MMEKRDITLSAEAQKKVLGVIGLARRARRLVAGTQIVCDSLKEKKALFVAVASDASENTKKRLFDRCAFYEKQIIILPVSSEELGAAIGRGGACAAVALTDASFVNAFAKAAGVEIQKM